MKTPDRETVSRLDDLPNIGKKTAEYLELAEIYTPQALIGQDAFELYDRLYGKTGKRFDPCIIDVFM